MTNKSKNKFLFIATLLILCFSILLNTKGTIEVCYALASWNPITGFQPGISVDIGGNVSVPDITITNPNTNIIFTNSDGSLKAYTELKVRNDKIDTVYGGWKHASFVEYFTIKRTDGRKIYDDDGYLDVSWWHSNGQFGYSDEIIDYKSELWVKTTLAPYNYNGFLETILNSKWKSNATFYITWDRGEDAEDVIASKVHDKDANTMGSGNYRNNGVNPGNEYYKLADWDYHDSPYITITLQGTAYWENGWWGGSYDHVDVYAFLSGFMPRSNRNWSNSLVTNDSNVTIVNNNLYSSKPFVAVATNLNNFIKVNDIKMTPITDQNVIPFKEGFRVAITDEGKTKVSIENGKENNYTDYYCIIDSTIPDVNLVYLNSNGLDKLKENAIQTDSNGRKTQTITGGIFRDKVQVNFSATTNESPEKCFVTFNGQTTEITSGTWLEQNGDYTVVVEDLVGNAKTIKFTIDASYPSVNIDNLSSDTNYKVSKWFLTSIPYGFTAYGTYSFTTYEHAFNKATISERTNSVTNYYLNNINNFHYTNLVANGDVIKVGNYWYYKSMDNPNLYVYYFNENLLNTAIEKYAKEYVSDANYFNYRTDIYPNNYGNKISSEIYHNLWNEKQIPAYIANNFIFRQINELESYKIYYDYMEDGQTNWTEFVYNVAFGKQVNNHGLYLIKEIDYVGHETYCYVYLDLQAPVLKVSAKIYGQDETFIHTVSKNDIPANGELVFYYEDFSIDDVIEEDTWYVIQIRLPNGTTKRFTYDDEIPDLSEYGNGEFTITAYDRISNNFSFKLVLLGKSPKVRFETINANTQLKINVISGENYNTLTDIKIYRNNILLNSNNGYDEYLDDDTNPLIFINTNITQYLFNKGGLYKVELTDNFGRITTHEFKFEKDLPLGVLKGVKDGGKTKNNVEFVFNSNKYTAIVLENGEQINVQSSLTDSNLTSLFLHPKDNTENNYQIILYDNTDFENFNIYKFTIKTLLPKLTLYGVEDNGVTSTDVYALWETQSGYNAKYTVNNSQELTYFNGQTLSADGDYKITLTDDLGNQNIKYFKIDKTLDFTIYEDTSLKDINEIRFTNKNIQIVKNEPLNIEVYLNSTLTEYSFNNFISDEGYYLIKIYDDFGNVKYFEFEIDKTPPEAELIGVENNKTTSGFVQVVWTEENLIGIIYKDGVILGTYNSGSEIKLNGKYQLKVSDRAGNFITFDFTIDNKIEFDINTFNGGISNGKVRVIAKEELTIVMHKNGVKIDYDFEQVLNEDGFYEFILTDILGNQTTFNFHILNKPLNRIEKKFYSFIKVIEIKKDGEIHNLDIQNNILYLVDEGLYTITVIDESTNKNFSFDLEIDTTPPTIQLVGTENGGRTKNEVSTKNPSETPVYLTATNNEKEFEYQIGEVIRNAGNYQIVVRDQAGNYSLYEFSIIYALNAASIALLGGMLALVVILIIFLVKTKVGYYKKNTEILTTEETIEEIDSIEKR